MLLVALLLAAAPAPAPPIGPQGEGVAATAESGTLGRVVVNTRAIFPAEGHLNLGRRIVNATHWTTSESVVRREVWKRPGDRVDADFAAELERNLRATGLFAEVEARLVPAGDDGTLDLHVTTRDRLSISGGASASFVGDVASGGFSLAESNLFGSGDRLSFGFFENDQGEFRGAALYRDRYVAGTWTTGTVEVGRTDQGDFALARLDRPFRYLEDDFSWRVDGSTAESERDYFLGGDTVSEVPFSQDAGGARVTWRAGTRFDFVTWGLALDHTTQAFGSPRGAPVERVPGDTDATRLALTASATEIARFEKLRGLDTLEFVQDVRFGTTLAAELGALRRDEDGRGAELQPTASARVTSSHRLGPGLLASASAGGSARTYAGEAQGWTAELDLRAYGLLAHEHTLAFAARAVDTAEAQGLPVQLTLGEDAGLRGYPRRQFTGDRLVRLNLEERWHPGLSLGALDVGAVVFADMGWIGDRGEGLGAPLHSVGVGLRLGSVELLGASVLRLDFSVPLDDRGGEQFDPLISFTLGQVFTFQ